MPAELKAKLSLDTASYERSVKQVKQANHDLRAGVVELKDKLATLFTLGAIVEYGHQILERAKDAQVLSEQLEVSVETAQAWDIALKDNNQSADKLASAITRIAEARKKALIDPSGDDAKAFSFFKITGEGLKESPVDILRAISDQMAKTGRSAKELTSLTELMGAKMATSLRVTLGQGLTNIEDQLAHTAEVMDLSTIKKVRELENALESLGRTGLAAGGKVLAGVMTAIQNMSAGAAGPNNLFIGMNPIPWLTGLGNYAMSDPKGDEAVAQKQKRLEDAQKKRANKEQTQKEIDEAPEKVKATHRLRSNHEAATNLVRLGNFAFTRGGSNPMESTLTRSMQIQQKIEQNTRPNRSVAGGDSSVPP